MRDIKFVCDKCRKEIGQPFGPLSFAVNSNFTGRHIEADFCSLECAESWVKDDLPQKIQP